MGIGDNLFIDKKHLYREYISAFCFLGLFADKIERLENGLIYTGNKAFYVYVSQRLYALSEK